MATASDRVDSTASQSRSNTEELGGQVTELCAYINSASYKLLERPHPRTDVLLIPKAWAEFQTTYGYVDDVAAVIAVTIGKSKAARQIFNVAE